MKSITEVFKEFCKERHNEDKGRNFDLLQEIYAKTEFFDIEGSELNLGIDDRANFSNNNGNCLFKTELVKDKVLPFECCFVKLKETENFNTFIFIREYSPTIITGTHYTHSPTYTLNMPFTINTELGTISVDKQTILNFFSTGFETELVSRIVLTAVTEGVLTLGVLDNLSRHTVIADIPIKARTEYYRRKKASTIKVTSRPIYYVLDKKVKEISQAKNIKSTGRLEICHSFKVRGHYRHINPNSYGKNRYGDYVIKGMTFVVEHVRGEGELTKRLRVVK